MEQSINTATKEVAIESPTISRIDRTKKVFVHPFNGQPYAVIVLSNWNEDTYYNARNKYQNVVHIASIEGNDDLIANASWVLTLD